MYAYRVIRSLGVQPQASISTEPSSSEVIACGEIVTGDHLAVGNDSEYGKNGPFLHCSKDPDGWLFEFQAGKRCLAPVPIQKGRWMYQVNSAYQTPYVRNPPGAGLALLSLSRPALNSSSKLLPEEVIPWGTVVLCDLRIERPAFGRARRCTFVRVAGSDGWLYEILSSDGRPTLLQLQAHASIEDALSKVGSQVVSPSRDDKMACDAVILVGPSAQAFHVHREVLAAASDVFRSLFTSGMKEDASSQAKLSTDEPDIFEQVLNFIYQTKVDISDLNALALLEYAHRYAISQLEDTCRTFISNNLDSADNAMRILPAACLLNDTWLCSVALHCISLKARSICQTSFEEMPLEMAKLILAVDLQLPELDVFRLASAWCQANKASDAEIDAIMSEVRLPLIPARALHAEVRPTGLVSMENLLAAMTYQATQDINAVDNKLLCTPRVAAGDGAQYP